MQLALFPDDRAAPVLDCEAVQVRLDALELRKPRQWGACWLACHLWGQLRLDDFWADKLPPSRQGTRWLNVFKTLVCYRLIDPGSEWRLHRHWYEQSAMADFGLRTSGWCRATSCTAAWTSWWPTSRGCLAFCANAGRRCSACGSTCCCTV